MKNILLLLFTLATLSLSAQEKDSVRSGLGDDNNPTLNSNESAFMNAYFAGRGYFDFTGKTICYVTGKTGNKIQTKSEFFTLVRSWTSRSTKVPTFMLELTKSEKEYCGYDAVLGYFVKDSKKVDLHKIIEKIKKK